MTDAVNGADPADLITDEIGRADASMVRTDTKAGLLLAVFGPLTAVGATLLTRSSLPAVAEVLFTCAAGLFGIAVLLLLWTIRPRLKGSGLLTYARMPGADMVRYFAELANKPDEWHCDRLKVVSQLALRKFRAVRLASSAIALGFLFVGAAVIAS
jgi:hypothetical protein